MADQVRVTQSCMVYGDTPPEGVSEAAQAALAPFDVQWSEHPVHGGWPGCLVERARWAEAFAALKDQAGFDMLVDHTAVDYPDRTPERFTVVGLLMNLDTQERLVVRTRVPEVYEQNAEFPSIQSFPQNIPDRRRCTRCNGIRAGRLR